VQNGAGAGACLEIRSPVPAWLQNGSGAWLTIRRGLGQRDPSVPGHRARDAEGVSRHGGGLVGGSVQARRGLGRAEAMGVAMREEGGDGGILVG
jgi:hypothetical protein